ncbi:MAG TPA: metalloregulator ArsR/SmtB family transcription factor [Devosia sp.]|nr:metalloregulator ArsR/SmtB family transcription factor [Devosia sp.]
MQNTPWSPRDPAERILLTLKMHGARSAAQLGEMLGTTGEAARQQLVKLAKDGLVASTGEPGAVGRPLLMWQLTPAAASRFPDTHAALTVQLLDIVRSTLGEGAIDAIVGAREVQTLKAYSAATEHQVSLRDKVAALAEVRAAEGYMAQWHEEPDGTLVLVENHCPICAAATICQGFCRSELDVFQAVLGAQVRRTEHMLAGARRCAYAITPDQGMTEND